MSKAETVGDIVEGWLKEHGYDGLYADDCGCFLGDLFPCDGEWVHCKPGYRQKCPGADDICGPGDEHCGPVKEER